MRIAVVIPAHNEAALIGACLRSVNVAAKVAAASGHSVKAYVVCDACTDNTERLVKSAGATALPVQLRNVGNARAYGADFAILEDAEWLALTDADSTVAPDWIVDQLSLGADVVCGTIQVDDWEAYGDAMADHFALTYFDIEGHRHVHGANLGMSVQAYRSVGGFSSLENSEDVDLVSALERIGARIAWTNLPRVTTSARTDFRATAGFGATLVAVARQRPTFTQPSTVEE